jgi:hypothetical protein
VSAYRWGDFAGQYTIDVTWKGVPVTVECDSEDSDVASHRLMLPVRVLVGRVEQDQVDITDLVDVEDGGLADLCQEAYDRREAA